MGRARPGGRATIPGLRSAPLPIQRRQAAIVIAIASAVPFCGFLIALEVDLALGEIGFPGRLEGFMRRFNNDPAIVDRAPTLPEFFAALEAVLGAERAAAIEGQVTRRGGLSLDRDSWIPDPATLWKRTVDPQR